MSSRRVHSVKDVRDVAARQRAEEVMTAIINLQDPEFFVVKEMNAGKLPEGDGFVLIPREKLVRKASSNR